MTDSKSGKVPKIGTLVYDSGIDTASGNKRAVLPGGGISVAERARLFGAQIPSASPFKPSKPTNLPVQRTPQNNRTVKPNVAFQDANYEPLKPKIDIYEYPKQETSTSPSSQQTNNDYRRFIRAEDRRRYDQHQQQQQQPLSDSRNHSAANRSRNHSQHSSSASQRSTNTYDRVQYEPRKKYTPGKPNSTKRIRPVETYAPEDDDSDYDYEEDEVEQAPYLKFYNPIIPPQNTTSQSSNYFQPIQDPLEVLMTGSSQGYYQGQPPTTTYADTNNLQPFDLGNLISRIQQDYTENVRPYVSSVQFVETNPSVVNLGYITPASTRKDYMRRTNGTYRRLGSSGNYDIIDTNGLYPYGKIPPKSAYPADQYSSMARKRIQRRRHNQASSPIHTVEYSSKTRTQRKPESPPPATTRKESIPVAASEEEEESSKAAAAAATKAKEAETSSENESEEEEDESVAKPAINPPAQASSQPENETTRAPVSSTAPVAAQRNDTARPAIANPTPAKKVESEESETEESESESESDSDEDEKSKPPQNTRTTAVAPQTTARGATITPQANTRGAPIAPQANNRGAPITQIGNARVNQQQTTADHHSTNDPPEEYAEEADSYNFGNAGKSLSFGGKLKSITNRFRRKKS